MFVSYDFKQVLFEKGNLDFIILYRKRGDEIPFDKQRADIKTGEQSISFFAKHGNNTYIKIFNWNRTKYSQEVFRPYNLEVVLDEKLLNEEHFTISNRGVVHIFKKNTKRMNEEEMIQTEFILPVTGCTKKLSSTFLLQWISSKIT